MDDDTHWLRIIVRGEVTDWERKFCASLIAQTNRGRKLSDKQAAILRRIRDGFRARYDDMIEGD
jgi:hypothetical protein